MLQYFFRVSLAVLGLGVLVSCAGPPELIGIDNPDIPAASVLPASRQKIFIATTRMSSEIAGAFYSDERSRELGFASVVVSVPPNHVTGNIERPEKMPPDPQTEFAVTEPAVYGTDTSFIVALNRELAKRAPKDRTILLFVHGYNNTISDSILRLGQFVEDTGFSGVPVLFSWASAARTVFYVYDLNSALTARPLLMQTANVLGRTNAVGFDVFAHSMGTFLTMEGFVQGAQSGRTGRLTRLDNLMLAAPDIDIDLFRTQINQIKFDKSKIFIFVSKDDNALNFSRRISGGVDRVGAADANELADFGVTVVDLSEIEDSASGSHSKFAGSPEVVQLIGRGLKVGNFSARSKLSLTDLLAGASVPIVVGR